MANVKIVECKLVDLINETGVGWRHMFQIEIAGATNTPYANGYSGSSVELPGLGVGNPPVMPSRTDRFQAYKSHVEALTSNVDTVASEADVDFLHYEPPATAPLSFSSSLNFGNILAGEDAELTITCTGAAVGDPVVPVWPSSLESELVGIMYVSATNTVTVRLGNINLLAAVNPASQTFAGRVLK
jgi:hypothetical protein